MNTKSEKSRTTVRPDDDRETIEKLHAAWRRDMARAIGAVEPVKAPVERAGCLSRVVDQLLAGEQK